MTVVTDANHYTNITICYRVYDETSQSPLLADGFTATHENFHPVPLGRVTNSEWHRRFQPPPFGLPQWLASTSIYLSVVNHVLGGWSKYESEYTGQSVWISTSASFDWAIWEIVRRLVCLGREGVCLSTIHRFFPAGYKGKKAISQRAAKAILGLQKGGRLERAQNDALKFARASAEVVFYGRIFAKDISNTGRWTTQHMGGFTPKSPEMEALFVPRGQRKGNNSWVDWLVFTPGERYNEAAVKIQERRAQLASSRRGWKK